MILTTDEFHTIHRLIGDSLGTGSGAINVSGVLATDMSQLVMTLNNIDGLEVTKASGGTKVEPGPETKDSHVRGVMITMAVRDLPALIHALDIFGDSDEIRWEKDVTTFASGSPALDDNYVHLVVRHPMDSKTTIRDDIDYTNIVARTVAKRTQGVEAYKRSQGKEHSCLKQ